MALSTPQRLSAAPDQLGDLVERILARTATTSRFLLGITGAPGAGKSMLSHALALALTGAGTPAAVVGLDGFHLVSEELERLGRTERKGAPDTFDVHGYRVLLRRLREQSSDGPMIYAPRYQRGAVEESIGSAVPVAGQVQVVLTEGNYLLLPQEPWAAIADLLDETWFVSVRQDLRRERLLARHLANGKSMARALQFTDGSDATNAELIAAGAEHADVIIDWGEAH